MNEGAPMTGIVRALPLALLLWLIAFKCLGETTIRYQGAVHTGENSVDCKGGKALFKHNEAWFRRNHGITLQMIRFFCERSNFTPETLSNRTKVYQQVSYYWNQRFLTDNYLQYSLLPPIKDNGIYYVGGFSSGRCTIRNAGFAYSNAGVLRSNGLSFDAINKVALAHENSHACGAKHHNGVYEGDARSYMNEAPAPWINNLVIDNDTRKEINKCVGRR